MHSCMLLVCTWANKHPNKKRQASIWPPAGFMLRAGMLATLRACNAMLTEIHQISSGSSES